MYNRCDDDILPARRRRGAGRRTGRPAPRPGRTAPATPTEPTEPMEPAARSCAGSAPRRGRTALAEVALTIGAMLGIVVTGVTVLASQTGLRPLVVRSGSMEPTIPTGAMVLVRRIDAAEIRPGDVVAVERPDRTRVTHRVVTVEPHGETAELTMKGDANEDPDALPVTVRHADRLVHVVPALGRVGAWFATPRGGFLLGSVLTAILTQVLRRRVRGGYVAAVHP